MGSVENMPYPSDFFDMVLSNEAISHYNDVDGFLREAARVLKRGGTLIIADGNNGANPRIREQTLRLWERCENDPPTIIADHPLGAGITYRRAETVD
ncbi:MAG: class I SAM-dependent methyltransferase [Candidatus Caldarchaeum sp.]